MAGLLRRHEPRIASRHRDRATSFFGFRCSFPVRSYSAQEMHVSAHLLVLCFKCQMYVTKHRRLLAEPLVRELTVLDAPASRAAKCMQFMQLKALW